jgi:hypothetical protein
MVLSDILVSLGMLEKLNDTEDPNGQFTHGAWDFFPSQAISSRVRFTRC